MAQAVGIPNAEGGPTTRSSTPSSREGDALPRAPEPALGDRRVDELEAELARVNDRYKRALADLDNYRKRSAQEVERRLADGRERLLRDWLDVVDSVDRAILMHQGSPVEAGLQAVLSQMQAVLSRHGVERLQPEGRPFDPTEHEAVASQPNAGVAPNTVVAVPRAGYRLGDRLLRPAQVVVSSRGREGS
jgi:molecular chaperone GrpE